MYLRARIGIDGDELKSTIGSIPHETIIKRFSKVKVGRDNYSNKTEKHLDDLFDFYIDIQ